MGEQTTFALKMYAIFLVVYLSFGIIDLYNSNWQIKNYDTISILGISIISFTLLLLNNVIGWILAFLPLAWIVFNPMNTPFLKEGLLFIFLKNPVFSNNLIFIELCIWTLVMVFVLALIIMELFKKRNYIFEIISGIYFLILSIFFLSGFLELILTNGFYVEQLTYPGFVFLGYIILILVAYFIKRKTITN